MPDQEKSPPLASQKPTAPEKILQRLEWQVIRRLDGQLQGDYRSLFYGYGVDFADLREYQPEDDTRYIDWNVTARMDKPYIRQYLEDREITAWFLVDLSPSMDFGSIHSEKREVLINIVALLARLLTRHGNRVGAILYSGQDEGLNGNHHRVERIIPARNGRNHVLRLINDLLKQPHLPHAGFTNLNTMLEGGLLTIKKRSLIFLLSDFISSPGWESKLSLLKNRHEVIAIRLWDQREMELPDIGYIWMEDAETGEQLHVDTHDPHFRAQFSAAAQRRQAELNGLFRRLGVEPWSISTSEDLVKAVVRFAALRRQHTRLRGPILLPTSSFTSSASKR